eukprot:11242592-Karenia_brevis.AAC.1
MPFIPLDADAQAKALEKGKADLKWVLADNEMSEEVQATILELGFCKLSTFLGLGETRSEVRETSKTEFNIDVADSLAMRAEVAKLLVSWDSAKIQVGREDTARAEAKAAQLD